MGKHTSSSSSHKEKDRSRDKGKHKSSKHSSALKHSKVIDDGNEDEWVEKDPQQGQQPESVQSIPTSQSLSLHSNPTAARRTDWLGMQASSSKPVNGDTVSTFDPRAAARDPTMTLDQAVDATEGYGDDFFGSMGSVKHKKDTNKQAPDPSRAKMSRFELNTGIYDAEGYKVEHTSTGTQPPSKVSLPKPKAGSSGSSWRMAKLRRVYETAEEEGRSLEEVALERYGTMESFQEALDEKRFLDEKDKPTVDEFGREIRRSDNDSPAPSSAKYIFNQNNPSEFESLSRPLSRNNSFRRPGTADNSSEENRNPSSRFATPKSSTPIPSVLTPPIRSKPSSSAPGQDPSTTAAVLSRDQLNKLQAQVLKAKLMNPDDPSTKVLEQHYEAELRKTQDLGGPTNLPSDNTEIRVLPTLDGQGRLYDLSGPSTEASSSKRKRKDPHFDSRDAKGEVLRYNADDDTTTLEDLVREEKFGAGSRETKDMDAEFASRIMGDAAFKDDLDYLDEEAERMARKKLKTADQKKLFAIQVPRMTDYAKTKKALDSCTFCYQDTEDQTVPPQVPIIALGTRAYLALGRYEGLTEGHCLIVPLQHQLTSLESDDDTWEEIKNFMKTLMQTFAEQDKGVIFFETVLNIRHQRHTCIEAVPVPWIQYEEAPGYFMEGIMAAESEWGTNKRLIDFSKKPGGFRRSMVPDLPYFMVQFDYKGEKGYGHVIEGHDGVQGGADGYDVDEGEKGGGKFEKFFAAETIGSMLELEPRQWRKPRRVDMSQDARRLTTFKKMYDKYDWTKMLSQSQDRR